MIIDIFSIFDPKTLSSIFFRNCKNLQYLSIDCVKITDKGIAYLTMGDGLKQLLHVDISGCNVSTD